MTPIVDARWPRPGSRPRALALLEERLRPLGMAPMAGGAAPERSSRRRGTGRWSRALRCRIAMVTGDFDLSGIGTVTHVEGNRVYGFGHPMFGLGACELADDDRLHPHRLSPGQREHEDGLAAQGRRRDRHRRQHQRRRPDRPEARHAAAAVEVKTGRYADSQTIMSRSSASRACCRRS